MGKKKKQVEETSEDSGNQSKVGDRSPKAYDNDVMASISMSQELKDEGNKLFCKRDLQGALIKYEKALKFLPTNPVVVSNLRSSMAACYMQMGLSEYPRAIHECDLALEVTPKYSISLLKRARCYKDLNRLDLALRDEAGIKVKSDFYEAFLALGQQQFEQAKLSWYYALSSDVDLATWPSPLVLQLYISSEFNMKKGMQIWEELEKQRLGKTSNSKDVRLHLQSMGLDGIIKI